MGRAPPSAGAVAQETCACGASGGAERLAARAVLAAAAAVGSLGPWRAGELVSSSESGADRTVVIVAFAYLVSNLLRRSGAIGARIDRVCGGLAGVTLAGVAGYHAANGVAAGTTVAWGLWLLGLSGLALLVASIRP